MKMLPALQHVARALLMGSAALLVGCAGTLQKGLPEDPAAQAFRYLPLTLPFVAVGDTQEHEATGFPLHDNDSAIDAFVEVTQRPPEQPLFGRRILEWALHQHPDEPWLHLGDVLDLSCRSEAERISGVFAASGRSGAILPGNHDGLQFGIYNRNILAPVLDPDANHWDMACRRGASPENQRHKTGNEALSKRDFISAYLNAQAFGPHALPGLKVPLKQVSHSVSWTNPDSDAFVSSIESVLMDGQAYSQSYVMQVLQPPKAPGATRRVRIIGLDTNQTNVLVDTWDTVMGHSPGSVGHVGPDQMAVVLSRVKDAVRDDDIVVFAGHHNWEALGLPTRTLLRVIMGNLKHPLVYLSAHTHRGFWAVHRALDRRPLLELNVSSLSDWPIAYRRISFAYDEQANRLLVRGDLMPRGVSPNTSDADVLNAWHQQTCESLGLKPDELWGADQALVQMQRETRGSVFNWIREALVSDCESCQVSRYEHAQAYQNELLTVLTEVDRHLGPAAHRLHEVKLPEWCAPADYLSCSQALQREQPKGLREHIALFRRKAELVYVLGTHLDDLQSPQARAYMTCRAVQAAKIDFDTAGEVKNGDNSEAGRRASQFFRIEASIGME